MHNTRIARLPLELRCQIWELSVCPPQGIRLRPGDHKLLRRQQTLDEECLLSLLQASRQVRREALPIFWSRNTFHIALHQTNIKMNETNAATAWTPLVRRWLHDIGQSSRAQLRSIVLDVSWTRIPLGANARTLLAQEIAGLQEECSTLYPQLQFDLAIDTAFLLSGELHDGIRTALTDTQTVAQVIHAQREAYQSREISDLQRSHALSQVEAADALVSLLRQIDSEVHNTRNEAENQIDTIARTPLPKA